MREEPFVQVAPEQAVAAHEQELRRHRRFGVPLQQEAGEIEEWEVELVGEQPQVAFRCSCGRERIGQPGLCG